MTLFVSLAALLVAQASPHPNNANQPHPAAAPNAGGPATPIGMAITLDHAKRVAAAAAAEAANPSSVWLDIFLREMQDVLLAELDVRFQPLEGLVAALHGS